MSTQQFDLLSSFLTDRLRLDDEFELWWSIYPRHVCKLAARRAYAKARQKVSFEALLKGLEAYRRDLERNPERSPCHAATYLNGERWEDEYDAPTPAPQYGDDESSETRLWRLRVRFYKKDKIWPPFCGEPPEDPRCWAPAEILAEFGFRAAH